MFVTTLNFKEVLDRFYHQRKYELMLLFVSSFDGNDKIILKEIVDNAKRIDRIIGKNICFFYFIPDIRGDMNESLVQRVKNISDSQPLYGEGISVTMDTADDICRHFGILRSHLPAFILVRKDHISEYQLFTIHEYQDFERLLTPLNILHTYIEDQESLISQYGHKSGDTLISQNSDSFSTANLKETDDTFLSLHDNLETIQQKAIEKLDIALRSGKGKRIIQQLNAPNGYTDAIWHIMQLINQGHIIDLTFPQNIITDKKRAESDCKIFISYKRVDKDKVFKIKDLIEGSTGEKCWIDLDGIESDAQFADVIIEAINKAEVFLFMYSHSHSQIENPDNDWTVKEINFAQKKGKRIIFINIDGTRLTDWFEMMFGTKQQINASSNMQMDKLCKDLRLWLNDVSERKPNEERSPITSSFSKIAVESDINISLSDKKVPIIVFAGPKSAGKTTAMIRLCSYLMKKGFTVKPNPTFRPDSLYNQALDAFSTMIESNLAPCRTSISGTILVDIFHDGPLKNLYSKIFKKSTRVCQMIDTSGFFFTNRQELPLFYHSILNAPNRVFWLLLADPQLSDTDSKKAYAERVKYIFNRRPGTDQFIIILNKIDTTKLMGRHGEIKDKQVLSFLSQEYPDLIELFKEKRKIKALISPWDCDIVPFQTGSYGPDGHFVPSNDSFPEKLFEIITSFYPKFQKP